MKAVLLRTDIKHRLGQIANLRYSFSLVLIAIITLSTWCHIVTAQYSVNCDSLCYRSTFLCSVDRNTMDLSVSPATCNVYYTCGELFKLRYVHERASLDLFNELSAHGLMRQRHRSVRVGKHKQ